jgi:phospholipid-binding lipoprotein MlaA
LLKSVMITLIFLFLGGCATTGSAPSDPGDPYEKINRSILKFNLDSDKYFLKPLAKGYEKVLPKPVRIGVRNFFSNLWEPMTIVNDLLQGKFAHAGRDTSRFVINTTLGLLGVLDVATEMNLPRRKEDFGQTLAVWGVPSGPYLVLPFLGPSNIRDTTGLIPQYLYGDALFYMDSPESLYVSSIRLVDTRARVLGTDELLEIQPDKYLFLREGFRQFRLNQIYDGNPPGVDGESSDDALIDQLLED